jgi:hypothetical protein
LEVADDLDQTVLLLVEAEKALVEVQSEVELVSALLDGQDVLLHLRGVVQVDQWLDPLRESLLLVLLEPRLDNGNCLLELCAFLLGLPVLTKDLADTILVELELLFELTHPDDLVDNFGDVSGVNECLIGAFLVK